MKFIFLLLSALAFIKSDTETFEFQSETSRLMEIIINSLYTQKEVFLRELISNAADANDKIRFLSIEQPQVIESQPDIYIRVSFNEDEKTISIEDSGIGMTKQDMISNLGTLAKSGTTNFLQQIKSGDMNLIGQFGVGFYSAFLVANRVQVFSRQHEDIGHVWESSAADQFTIAEAQEDLPRGTKVVLHLKQEALEYNNEQKLRELIQRHSEFINFPIFLQVQKTIQKEVDLSQEELEAQEQKNAELPEAEQKTNLPTTKNISVQEPDWEQVNVNKAIWLRDKTEIETEEYNNFYKSFTKDTEDPLIHSHFKGEGEVEFSSILYIPSSASWNLINQYYDKQVNLKLYVRRVLIQDKFDDVVPKYLNFIKGIIDSDDLPLNVNREALQQSKIMKTISKKLTKKTLDMITELAKDEEKYKVFWRYYSKNIKMGLIEDQPNQEKLMKLVRFRTSKNQTELVSFEQYLSRAKENQNVIYYMGGETKDKIMASPVIQSLVQKDFEVFLFDEPIDEYAFQRVGNFEGKTLVNIAKGDFKLPEDDSQRRRTKALKKTFSPLTEWWMALRKNVFQSVQISQRLVEDPILVVATSNADSANLERIYNSQANHIKVVPRLNEKILEINPNHPMIQQLLQKIVNQEDMEDTTHMVELLTDVALVNSGFSLQNLPEFSQRVYGNLNLQLGLERTPKIKEMEVDLSIVDEQEGAGQEEKPADGAFEFGQEGGDINLDDFQGEFENTDFEDIEATGSEDL